MTDTAPDMGTTTTTATTTTAPDKAAPDAGATPTLEDLQAETEKWKAQARKHEDRAKANAVAAKELEQVKQAAMNDQEKAVAEAVAKARTETLAEVGGRLAASEIRVAAAGRLDDAQLTTLLEDLNLSRFLADTGEVDTDRVKAFVEGIAPKPTDGPTVVDLGQGARGGPALNGDPLLDSLKAAVGIR